MVGTPCNLEQDTGLSPVSHRSQQQYLHSSVMLCSILTCTRNTYIYTYLVGSATCSFVCFFPSSFLCSSHFFLLFLPPYTLLRSHPEFSLSVALLPPSPLRYAPSFLSREDSSYYSSRRLASNRAYPDAARRSLQLIPAYFFFCE